MPSMSTQRAHNAVNEYACVYPPLRMPRINGAHKRASTVFLQRYVGATAGGRLFVRLFYLVAEGARLARQ